MCACVCVRGEERGGGAHSHVKVKHTVFTLTNPETLFPTSLMKGYFRTSFLATSVEYSVEGLDWNVNIWVTRSQVISPRMD